MADVGSRIKEVRKDNKLTQEQFGEKIGLKDSAVSMLEKNDRRLTECVIKNIVSQFCVNEIWLKFGVGEKYNEDLIRKRSLLNVPLFGNQLLILEKTLALSPSNQDIILRIADLMNASDANSTISCLISKDEENLLNNYRILSSKDKDEILSFIDFKVCKSEALKKKERSSNCSNNKKAADIKSNIV
ncbi:MAG: transcriptional regulator, family [Eubacterium sp.]|nr:transcriptional regulator, family [Eubacterium sp.]